MQANFLNAVITTAQPLIFISGAGARDIHTNDNLELTECLRRGFIKYYGSGSVTVEVYNAGYCYSRDGAIDPVQQKYRPIDASCCNMSVLTETMSTLDNKVRVVIVELTTCRKDAERDTFCRQVADLLKTDSGNNKLIIIGDDSDLQNLTHARSGMSIMNIELMKPGEMVCYINEQFTDEEQSKLGKKRLEDFLLYAQGRYQRTIYNDIVKLRRADFSNVAYQELIDQLKVESVRSEEPKVDIDDIVGFKSVKEMIRKKIILPLQYPDDFMALSIKSAGGILLFGLPGCGKTVFAQAIARSIGAVFYYIKLSDVLSEYYGKSEQNIAQIFNDAKRQECAVIFLDEADALTGHRGGDSSATDRVVTELLTQMTSLGSNVLVIAATNRPWAMDSAFLRNERFGQQAYIPLLKADERREMLERMVGKYADNIDFVELSQRTEYFNGADIKALYTEAATNALISYREKNERDRLFVCMADFEAAFKEVHSTVSKDDAAKMAEYLSKKPFIDIYADEIKSLRELCG